MTITTIDLNFIGQGSAIAAYLISHKDGVALVECGPSSTLPAAKSALSTQGFQTSDVTDIFLTHIHLDHAGSAGWWARQGARIHVHPIGAPHMLNPEKLISSATRIYGDQMDVLWGEFLPVPESKLITHNDGDMVNVSNLQVEIFDSPGHATHHFTYVIEGTAFTGDIGGMRMPEAPNHMRLPTPPPEFHLETWLASIARLQNLQAKGKFQRVAPTHFGQYDDAAWHLQEVVNCLHSLSAWMEEVLPKENDLAEIVRQFTQWEREQAVADGLNDEQIDALWAASGSEMSAGGVARYWRKYRESSK